MLRLCLLGRLAMIIVVLCYSCVGYETYDDDLHAVDYYMQSLIVVSLLLRVLILDMMPCVRAA